MDSSLRIEDCVNAVCLWSGDPVSADSLTLYNGSVVGFCNPGCRDKFEKAVGAFDSAREAGAAAAGGADPG